MNNAGVLGTDESELQRLAADRDYNPLVLANLEDADRLIAFVVHKPTFVPARLKPVIYADALRHRDLLDKIFWIIAEEMEKTPLTDELGTFGVRRLIRCGSHETPIDFIWLAVPEAGIAGSRRNTLDHRPHGHAS